MKEITLLDNSKVFVNTAHIVTYSVNGSVYRYCLSNGEYLDSTTKLF